MKLDVLFKVLLLSLFLFATACSESEDDSTDPSEEVEQDDSDQDQTDENDDDEPESDENPGNDDDPDSDDNPDDNDTPGNDENPDGNPEEKIEAPSKYFNLSGWKLTLPVSKDSFYGEGGESAAEVKPDSITSYNDVVLDQGYLNENFFYYDTEAKAIVFRTPLDGGSSTVNSSYVRTEMRELFDLENQASDSDANWPNEGSHELKATVQVVEYYDEDPQTVVGQIHAKDSSKALVKLQWDGPDKPVRAIINEDPVEGNPFSLTFEEVGTDKFDYSIKLVDTTITITVGETTHSVTFGEDNMSLDWIDHVYYFKWGSYPQAAKDSGGTFLVRVFDYAVIHGESPEPTPPVETPEPTPPETPEPTPPTPEPEPTPPTPEPEPTPPTPEPEPTPPTPEPEPTPPAPEPEPTPPAPEPEPTPPAPEPEPTPPEPTPPGAGIPDADVTPSSLFNLRNFKLTLPVTKDEFYGSGGTSAAEVKPSSIAGDSVALDNNYRDDKYFFIDKNSKALVFRTPLDGGAGTPNTSYVRTEFRELFNLENVDSDSQANWPNEGTHQLSATVQVPVFYDKDPQTVVGQIHAKDSSKALVKLQWDGPEKPVRAIINKDPVDGNPFSLQFGVVGTDKFDYVIRLVDETITITVDDITQSVTFGQDGMSEDWNDHVYYFKAGNYAQADKSSGGIFEVHLFKLDIFHQEGVSNPTPPPADPPTDGTPEQPETPTPPVEEPGDKLNNTPSENFDLSDWKLTLPISKELFYNEGGNSAAEVKPSRIRVKENFELDNKFEDQRFFFTDPATGAMVFRTPLDGGAGTPNTSYVRSELRELYNLKPGQSESDANWDNEGLHRLSATVQVREFYDKDPQTVVGQIHAKDSSKALVKLQWDGPSKPVRAIINADPEDGNPFSLEFGEVGTNAFDYEIELIDRTITITVDNISRSVTFGEGDMSIDWVDHVFYFKIGNYAQADKSSGGLFEVHVSKFKVEHQP